jgi:hypothetical protein
MYEVVAYLVAMQLLLLMPLAGRRRAAATSGAEHGLTAARGLSATHTSRIQGTLERAGRLSISVSMHGQRRVEALQVVNLNNFIVLLHCIACMAVLSSLLVSAFLWYRLCNCTGMSRHSDGLVGEALAKRPYKERDSR